MTTTELTEAEREERRSEIRARIQTGESIDAIVPSNLDDAFRLATALSKSGDLIPEHFRGDAEMIMAAILSGMEVKLTPMQALKSIAVINGRATLWGDALPALMQKSGHHIDHVVEDRDGVTTAIATLTRGDTGHKYVREFSMEDAKTAGLMSKKGPWQQYPKRMLAMRARSWACRDGAADALMGIEVREEVLDQRNMRDVTPKESGFAKMAQEAGENATNNAKKPIQHTSAFSTSRATDADPVDAIAVDVDSPAYQMGLEAGAGDMITIDQCPKKDDPVFLENWLEGFRVGMPEQSE
jgi:hypothetical protein